MKTETKRDRLDAEWQVAAGTTNAPINGRIYPGSPQPVTAAECEIAIAEISAMREVLKQIAQASLGDVSSELRALARKALGKAGAK